MKNSKFLRSKNLLKSLEAEELKSLNDKRDRIATEKQCAMYNVQCTINDNGNEQQLKTKSDRNDGHSSVIPEKDISVISSERSDERSAVCSVNVNKTPLSRAAFTLVELVITIAIVIILSVISVPIYRGYVNKAMMSEGYALLGIILSAQKAYFSEYGNFLRSYESCTGGSYWTNNETVLGIDARGNKYFTRFGVGDGSSVVPKYYFNAQVLKPEILFEHDTTSFLIQYNITKGAKIVDYPKNYDASWKQ